MTINRRCAALFTATVAVLFATSCTSQQTRTPSGISASFVTPTAEQLFLKGKFAVQKSPLKFLDEDNFGKELDLSERRPVADLRGTIFEQKYFREGTRLIANFYHRGEFYIARIPDRAVKNVYFQLSYFPPKALGRYIAAHSLLRFELAAPIELVAKMPTIEELELMARATPEDEIKMMPAPLTGEENLVRNVVISAEAQWVKNDKYKKYSLKRGMLGAYIQIVRFVSMQTRFEGFYSTGNPATQVRFQLKDENSGDKILAEALRTSESDGLTKLYDTFWYNCTTIAFDMVERAEGIKDQRLGFIRSFMQKRIPVAAPAKLESYGAIEAEPIGLDPSLFDDSEEAYQDKIAIPKRELCPEAFEDENCDHVKAAVDALKAAGRI